jgi:hypothetical protein
MYNTGGNGIDGTTPKQHDQLGFALKTILTVGLRSCGV